MVEKAAVFETTYHDYLERIAAIDFLARADRLGAENDKDEEFPAQCAVMFPQSAEAFLDMECMAIGGTLLAGTLTRSLQHP